MCCHAGCSAEDIVSAMRLEMRDLMPPREARSSNGRASRGRITATYPYHDKDGNVLFEVCRFEPKDFRQRRPDPDNPGRHLWSVKGIEKVPYHLPMMLDAALVFVPEGEKDVHCLEKLGLVATCNAGGAGKWKGIESEYFRAKVVHILVDNDDVGRDHGEDIAKQLSGVAKTVKVVELPDLPQKGDVSDWLDAGHTADELQVFCEAVDEWQPQRAKQPPDPPNGFVEAEFIPPVDSDVGVVAKSKATAMAVGLPQIVVGVDESRVIDEAIAALVPKSDIFQRAGGLVQIVQDVPPPRGIARPKDAPRIVQIKLARLRELLASSAEWLRPDGNDKLVQCHPPEWVTKGVEARGQWSDVRPIEGIVESPVVRSDGSVLQTPGYDPGTGLLFRPRGVFPQVPASPTIDDARKAVASLLGVVADFPFADAVHQAAWLSGVLTPLARFAFYGPAPLHLIDANVRGSGKSLLADTIGEITFGRAMARMAAPSDDDEFRKRITALALAAEPLVLIDNVATALGGPAIDAALTATAWSDRMLGQSKMVTGLPLTMTWFATGNNVVLMADTARRTLHIRLESPHENPEERSGFRHPNLLAWVRRNRALLVTAAVTVLAAYFAAGRPDMRLKPWGSFEAWSDLVRQAIVWVGYRDPGETRQELAGSADIEANALRRLIEGWAELDPDGYGMTVAKVLDAIEDFQRQAGTMPSEYQTIRDALVELVPTKGGRLPSAKSAGMKLNRFRQRVVDGRYLDSRSARDGNYWVVKTVQKEGNVRD